MQEHLIFTAPQTVKEWVEQPADDEEPEVEFLSPRWPTPEQRELTSKPGADEASTVGTSPSPRAKTSPPKGSRE